MVLLFLATIHGHARLISKLLVYVEAACKMLPFDDNNLQEELIVSCGHTLFFVPKTRAVMEVVN